MFQYGDYNKDIKYNLCITPNPKAIPGNLYNYLPKTLWNNPIFSSRAHFPLTYDVWRDMFYLWNAAAQDGDGGADETDHPKHWRYIYVIAGIPDLDSCFTFVHY